MNTFFAGLKKRMIGRVVLIVIIILSLAMISFLVGFIQTAVAGADCPHVDNADTLPPSWCGAKYEVTGIKTGIDNPIVLERGQCTDLKCPQPVCLSAYYNDADGHGRSVKIRITGLGCCSTGVCLAMATWE